MPDAFGSYAVTFSLASSRICELHGSSSYMTAVAGTISKLPPNRPPIRLLAPLECYIFIGATETRKAALKKKAQINRLRRPETGRNGIDLEPRLPTRVCIRRDQFYIADCVTGSANARCFMRRVRASRVSPRFPKPSNKTARETATVSSAWRHPTGDLRRAEERRATLEDVPGGVSVELNAGRP